MKDVYRIRRTIAAFLILVGTGIAILLHPSFQQSPVPPATTNQREGGEALHALHELEVKGRAPKNGYTRNQFGDGWVKVNGCDMRNSVLYRDLLNAQLNEDCQVERGTLRDPYTGETIQFQRGTETSDDVQIDHVVALSDAWQKGAQGLTPDEREKFANDPLNLLAVDGTANQQKGDSDAATWLPPNKLFRCQYLSRQVAVKKKYRLWITQAEKDAISRVLATCPGQRLPAE